MAKPCSRDPVLEYISKFNINNNTRILKKHIIGWCFSNQGHLDCTEKTYIDRVAIMTIGTGKHKAQRHPEGFDDVFIPDVEGYIRLA